MGHQTDMDIYKEDGDYDRDDNVEDSDDDCKGDTDVTRSEVALSQVLEEVLVPLTVGLFGHLQRPGPYSRSNLALIGGHLMSLEVTNF